MADIDIPANENWQYDSESFALSALSMTAGELTQIEITRIDPAASPDTNLVGDWALLGLTVEFN